MPPMMVEDGHSLEEYLSLFGAQYEEGALWDFSEGDLLGGAVEADPEVVYWRLADGGGEIRFFETPRRDS